MREYPTSGNATEATEGDGLRREDSKETSVSVAHNDLMDRIEGARAREPAGASRKGSEGIVDSSSSVDDVILDSEGSDGSDDSEGSDGSGGSAGKATDSVETDQTDDSVGSGEIVGSGTGGGASCIDSADSDVTDDTEGWRASETGEGSGGV